MSKVDPVIIDSIITAVLAALRRAGRLPTRLDEEDYDDLRSEGTLAALLVMDGYDSERGSLRAYLDKPITRAILKAAWGIANAGITGDHGSLQVFSRDTDHEIESEFDDGGPFLVPDVPELQSPDVADEIEAFDHVWKTRYLRD